MLQSMGPQKVGHDLVTGPQQCYFKPFLDFAPEDFRLLVLPSMCISLLMHSKIFTEER